MKKVEIINFSFAEAEAPNERFGFLRIPAMHKRIRAEGEDLQVSDGYHTFDELYDHRITLYIALCAAQRLFTDKEVWRSKRHSDGELCFGTGTQFVLGINSKAGEQITYHIPIGRWDETNFAITLEKGHEWDGHSSADILDRIKII